jgi:monofunctional biosynthetic peptidoglycan transglycosylase
MNASQLAALLFLQVLVLPATANLAKEPTMRPLINFDESPKEPRWVAVNDGVMGGRSRGSPLLVNGQLQFSGELSLENNGGFASVRSVGRTFDLSGDAAVLLRVRGDGRRYQLRLATDASYRGMAVSYAAEFATTDGQWTEVRIGLDTLLPAVRGFALPGPSLDPSRVREIGLLIGDKRAGPFALTVDWIGVQ